MSVEDSVSRPLPEVTLVEGTGGYIRALKQLMEQKNLNIVVTRLFDYKQLSILLATGTDRDSTSAIHKWGTDDYMGEDKRPDASKIIYLNRTKLENDQIFIEFEKKPGKFEWVLHRPIDDAEYGYDRATAIYRPDAFDQKSIFEFWIKGDPLEAMLGILRIKSKFTE